VLPRIARKLGSRLIDVSKIDLKTSPQPTQLFGNSKAKDPKDLSDDRIAVIGMATQVPGAEDIGEVWKVLKVRKPQHREVPKEQFEMETTWREADPNRKGHGNFIDAYVQNLIDFFEDHFIRMSCGGLILDTAKSRKYSATLSKRVPMSRELCRNTSPHGNMLDSFHEVRLLVG
jgi:hypothetical protein